MDTAGFPAEWRKQIREQILSMGMPADRADLIIDLAIHATNMAFDKLGDVCKTAGLDTLNVLSIALQLVSIRAEIATAATCEFMDELGKAVGADRISAKIELGVS